MHALFSKKMALIGMPSYEACTIFEMARGDVSLTELLCIVRTPIYFFWLNVRTPIYFDTDFPCHCVYVHYLFFDCILVLVWLLFSLVHFSFFSCGSEKSQALDDETDSGIYQNRLIKYSIYHKKSSIVNFIIKKNPQQSSIRWWNWH